MALPSLLYMVGALVIGFSLVKRMAGVCAAVFALLCAMTVPLFMVQGSIANIDMPELFFQMASIALFLKGAGKADPARWFFAAGVMAGLGFLSRETSVFIAGFYAVLFLINFEGRRWPLLWVAAGFLAMWGVELFYLGIMTGDPFYRINIAMHHDSSIDRSIDLAGNFIMHPAIDPLLVLLFNQEIYAALLAGDSGGGVDDDGARRSGEGTAIGAPVGPVWRRDFRGKRRGGDAASPQSAVFQRAGIGRGGVARHGDGAFMATA